MTRHQAMPGVRGPALAHGRIACLMFHLLQVCLFSLFPTAVSLSRSVGSVYRRSYRCGMMPNFAIRLLCLHSKHGKFGRA